MAQGPAGVPLAKPREGVMVAGAGGTGGAPQAPERPRERPRCRRIFPEQGKLERAPKRRHRGDNPDLNIEGGEPRALCPLVSKVLN